MRRSLALALASLSLGIGTLFVGAAGCNSSALGVQDLCGWLADECNCYRRFAAGVANSTVDNNNVGTKPLCGVQLDANKNAINSATNTIYPAATKPTIGTFLSREKLDICILTGSDGGQIIFDPPLDPLAFPPANFAFKILDGTGKLCGDGTFGSSTSFSIGFPAPEGTGGSGGAGGSTGGGGAGGAAPSGLECRGEPDVDDEDPAREAISYGTFSITGTDPTNVVETSCPNEEKHRFNLLQLEKCDGVETTAGVTEENYKALLPTAEVEATAGGVNVPGEVRLRISWPQSEPVATLDGAKAITVEYFDCLFPGAIHPCLNGAQDGAEVDVDCGFSACAVGCPDGANCTIPKDCISGICTPNEKGLKKCVSTPCGDGAKNGLETCDDGNTNDNDGCSSTCAQEPGFICTDAGPGSCMDIDECAQTTPPCGANAICGNTAGSFTGTCSMGFSGDGMTCTPGCGDGVKGATEGCDDGNTLPNDGCSPNCAVGSGYTCMGEGPGSCIDNNECVLGTDTCLDTEDCGNTPGSFTCTCKVPDNKVCNGTCIDITGDLFNCGDCGKTCLPGQLCTAGVCAAP